MLSGDRTRPWFRIGPWQGRMVLRRAQVLLLDDRPRARDCRNRKAGSAGRGVGQGRWGSALRRWVHARLCRRRPQRRRRLHQSGSRAQSEPRGGVVQQRRGEKLARRAELRYRAPRACYPPEPTRSADRLDASTQPRTPTSSPAVMTSRHGPKSRYGNGPITSMHCVSPPQATCSRAVGASTESAGTVAGARPRAARFQSEGYNGTVPAAGRRREIRRGPAKSGATGIIAAYCAATLRCGRHGFGLIQQVSYWHFSEVVVPMRDVRSRGRSEVVGRRPR